MMSKNRKGRKNTFCWRAQDLCNLTPDELCFTTPCPQSSFDLALRHPVCTSDFPSANRAYRQGAVCCSDSSGREIPLQNFSHPWCQHVMAALALPRELQLPLPVWLLLGGLSVSSPWRGCLLSEQTAHATSCTILHPSHVPAVCRQDRALPQGTNLLRLDLTSLSPEVLGHPLEQSLSHTSITKLLQLGIGETLFHVVLFQKHLGVPGRLKSPLCFLPQCQAPRCVHMVRP